MAYASLLSAARAVLDSSNPDLAEAYRVLRAAVAFEDECQSSIDDDVRAKGLELAGEHVSCDHDIEVDGDEISVADDAVWYSAWVRVEFDSIGA